MMNIQSLANPGKFQRLTDALTPWLAVGATILFAWGLWQALIVSPPDYQQGEAVRIMYVHVPAAWMAMQVYVLMAVAAAIGLIWKHALADLFCRAAAPAGACFTALCLITGSLWGKPMWGAWWVWDARLTSVLVLLFLYIGYMVLVNAFDSRERGDRAGAVLLLIGAVNVPIIKFSVDWWHTLHQPASVLRLKGPALDNAMLKPLLIMAAAYFLYALVVIIWRMKAEIAVRKIEGLKFRSQ
jgi:heme exporter protein C